VYHEFAHAVSDAICRLGRTQQHTQSRGMSEGYSDYFAASALNDPRIGDYVLNNANGDRNLTNPGLRFPAGFAGEEHSTGEVWAAILWDVRTQCGPGVTDLLALESLQFLSPNATFNDGLAALITADRRLFPTRNSTGRHEAVLNTAFNSRL
jgi:fungalysin metallopeptidase (M36)